MAGTCNHLQRLLEGGGSTGSPLLAVQDSLLECWRGRPTDGNAAAEEGCQGAAFVCLGCSAGSSSLAHALAHECRQAQATGAPLALDMLRGELLCRGCKDYVYHPVFDNIMAGVRAAVTQFERPDDQGGAPMPGSGGSGTSTGVARSNGNAGEGDEDRLSLDSLRSEFEVIDASGTALLAPRGLTNLGNTCFINSILQALLHAPLLRNYYLGGGHPAEACLRGSEGGCLSCELDAVFNAAYSGDAPAFSPASFLYCWWQVIHNHLAGYQQHDAHEFYLYLMSHLGSSRSRALAPQGSMSASDSEALARCAARPMGGANGHMSVSCTADPYAGSGEQYNEYRSGDSGGCGNGKAPHSEEGSEEGVGESIVERVFGGLLRSDVTCCTCGYTSTAYDPFLDISLDVEAPPAMPPPPLRPPPGLASKAPPVAKKAEDAAGAAPAPAPPPAAAPAPPRGGPSMPQRDSSGRFLPKAVRMAAEAARGGGGAADTDGDTDLISARSSFATDGEDDATDARGVAGRRLQRRHSGRVADAAEAASSLCEASSAAAGARRGGAGGGAAGGAAADEATSPPGVASAAVVAHKADGGGGGSRKRKAPPQNVTRCGVCHTCRNKHLKKACLRNRALKLSGRQLYEAVLQALRGGVPPKLLPKIPHEYCTGLSAEVLSQLGTDAGLFEPEPAAERPEPEAAPAPVAAPAAAEPPQGKRAAQAQAPAPAAPAAHGHAAQQQQQQQQWQQASGAAAHGAAAMSPYGYAQQQQWPGAMAAQPGMVAVPAGQAGMMGMAAGQAGMMALPGQPGMVAVPGQPGMMAMQGQAGMVGMRAQAGMMGVPGQPGMMGVPGQPGMVGVPGHPGMMLPMGAGGGMVPQQQQQAAGMAAGYNGRAGYMQAQAQQAAGQQGAFGLVPQPQPAGGYAPQGYSGSMPTAPGAAHPGMQASPGGGGGMPGGRTDSFEFDRVGGAGGMMSPMSPRGMPQRAASVEFARQQHAAQQAGVAQGMPQQGAQAMMMGRVPQPVPAGMAAPQQVQQRPGLAPTPLQQQQQQQQMMRTAAAAQAAAGGGAAPGAAPHRKPPPPIPNEALALTAQYLSQALQMRQAGITGTPKVQLPHNHRFVVLRPDPSKQHGISFACPGPGQHVSTLRGTQAVLVTLDLRAAAAVVSAGQARAPPRFALLQLMRKEGRLQMMCRYLPTSSSGGNQQGAAQQQQQQAGATQQHAGMAQQQALAQQHAAMQQHTAQQAAASQHAMAVRQQHQAALQQQQQAAAAAAQQQQAMQQQQQAMQQQQAAARQAMLQQQHAAAAAAAQQPHGAGSSPMAGLSPQQPALGLAGVPQAVPAPQQPQQPPQQHFQSPGKAPQPAGPAAAPPPAPVQAPNGTAQPAAAAHGVQHAGGGAATPGAARQGAAQPHADPPPSPPAMPAPAARAAEKAPPSAPPPPKPGATPGKVALRGGGGGGGGGGRSAVKAEAVKEEDEYKPPSRRATPPLRAPTPPRALTPPRAPTPPVLALSDAPPPGGSASLLGCLHRFVRPEALGVSEKWTCSSCKTRQRGVKQMSIRRLPPVLCLHVKRFEHFGVNGVGRKLETPLSFPVTGLDLTPFLSSTIIRERFALRRCDGGVPASDRGARGTSPAPGAPPGGALYDLYCVVCHKGGLAAGHYVAYVRGSCGQWFLCDDAWVLEVDEAQVRAAQPYMLFYVQTALRC